MRKVRPLLDLIRGHYADDALDVLKYMPHRGARMVEQVLKSAMANAEDKGVRNVGELVVIDARGDGGPMFKRLMPRARGMAYLIRRRTAHIAIGLADLATDAVEQPTRTRRRGRMIDRPESIRAADDDETRHDTTKGRLTHGPKGSTDRVPRGNHGGLAEPLVRFQARVRRPPGRRFQDPRVHQEEVRLRRASPRSRSSGPATR